MEEPWLNKERKNLSSERLCSADEHLSCSEKYRKVDSNPLTNVPSTPLAPMVDRELANEQVILKASQGVWERLSSAKHDWVVLVLFRFEVWRGRSG